MIIKTTFEDSRKVNRIKNYAFKCNLYLYFLIKQKLLISNEKNVDVYRTQGVYHVIYVFSGSSLSKV